MTFIMQPNLQNQKIRLQPLRKEDFDLLYAIASDPLIWEQHPNKERYKKEVFQNFFKAAMDSGGAFVVFDVESGTAIGSTRFYDYDPEQKSILIGYSFLSKKYWGKQFNISLKSLMLQHAFQFVESVYFHIGAENFRSQRSIVKTGAVKIGEAAIAYIGEPEKLNFIYCLQRKDFQIKR